MRVFCVLLTLTFVSSCIAQDQDSILAVLDFKWTRVHLKGQKIESDASTPVRAVIPENKLRQRQAREQQTMGAIDPNEYTVDGRSAALERNVRESRALKTEDANGFHYSANIKNNSDRKVEIVYWEYRFMEFANPANVVRRQFLCSMRLKPGDKIELLAFSLLGPSEVISAESLTDAAGKLFDEKVLINRIEYADGAILQRREWKMSEVKAGIEKATSTSWGKEICRPL